MLAVALLVSTGEKWSAKTSFLFLCGCSCKFLSCAAICTCSTSNCPNIPEYSGKLSREKTFANFAVLWLYAKVFSVKFGVWYPLALQKRAIRESFLRKNRIFTNSRKFSPLKVSRYTVHSRLSNILSAVATADVYAIYDHMWCL